MKLTFLDKASAQTRADSIHAQMKATNALYKESCDLYVSSGGKVGTARWDFPKQDLEQDDKSPNFGNPLDTLWHVTVDERPRPVLTKAETDSIPEWKVAVEAIVK